MNTTEVAIMTMTVNEAIRRYPATVAVFNRRSIDTCCGGALPIEEAAARAGVEISVLRAELLAAIGADAST